MTAKEKEINTKVRNARLIIHNIMRDVSDKWIYDHLVDTDKELYEISDMLINDNDCNVERNAYLIAQIMDADAKCEEYVRPINYYDCASALLKMWMDNVLTDSEYYKIIDKLNANRKEGEE